MFNMTLKAGKEGFFDRTKVEAAVGAARKKVLSAQGQEVQYQAKGLLWKRKGPSRPGEPPHMHLGLIKRFLYFGFDFNARSVVIGPTLIGRPTGAPETLEYGGDTTMQEFLWKTRDGKRTLEKKQKRIHIAARPYMHPALARAQPKLAGMWANSIR